MKVIIDRFEGAFAVVETEDKMLINMPKELVPQGAAEGSVVVIEIDMDASSERHKKVTQLMNSVFKD